MGSCLQKGTEEEKHHIAMRVCFFTDCSELFPFQQILEADMALQYDFLHLLNFTVYHQI